jgi:DNA-binding transcriptional LysR family regulator
MPDMRSLELLVGLADRGSYTQVARRMQISVGAASKMISRLEKELGVRLLNRTTRLVSLTQQGRLLAEKSRLALAEMAEAIDLIHLEQRGPVGTVRALIASPIARYCIFPLLPRFQQSYPGITLETSLHDGPPDLAEHGFDIAIADWVRVSDQYVSRKLCTMPIVAVASPDYLERRGVPRTVEELTKHDCLNIRLASGDLTEWRFVLDAEAGLAARKAAQTKTWSVTPIGRLVILNQYDAVISAALAGLGITLAYGHAIRRHLDRGELKVILPDYRIEPGDVESNQYRIHYANRKYMPMAQRAIVDFLVENLARQGYDRFDRHAFAG